MTPTIAEYPLFVANHTRTNPDAIHPGLTRPDAPDTGIVDDAKNGLIPSHVPFRIQKKNTSVFLDHSSFPPRK
jgi:hypothetical protein